MKQELCIWKTCPFSTVKSRPVSHLDGENIDQNVYSFWIVQGGLLCSLLFTLYAKVTWFRRFFKRLNIFTLHIDSFSNYVFTHISICTIKYIEDITLWREDMADFIFEWWKEYFTNERSEWVKYFLHDKIKFISSSHCVNFFLLYRLNEKKNGK